MAIPRHGGSVPDGAERVPPSQGRRDGGTAGEKSGNLRPADRDVSHRQYRCQGSTPSSDEHRRDDASGSCTTSKWRLYVRRGADFAAARRRPRTAVCPCIGRMAVACEFRSTPIVQKGQTAAAVSFVGFLHLPL